MKVATGLLSLLLASLVLPSTVQPVHAQALDSRRAQLQDEIDGRMLQSQYNFAYVYAFSNQPPYSAEQVTEQSQTLADGNQIKKITGTKLRYRDHEGRVRIDEKLASGRERIFIADPKAKTAYLIRPERKDILRVQGIPAPRLMTADFVRRPTTVPVYSRQVLTPLGTRDFAGVTAVGIHTDTYYPAGTKGNEKEMVETSETWTSNQFFGYMYSRTSSPIDGEQIVRLDNLKFVDQPASLFAIPGDYPIRDLVLESPPADQ